MDQMGRAANRGLSVPELLLAIAVVAVLAVVAVPSYSQYAERARVAQATTDITALEMLLSSYRLANRDYPNSLSQIGADGKLDPWGQPYVYLVFRTPADLAQARKDKNLVPINSDYDLYSKGKDHNSKPPLLAQPSRDDVVRGNDGSFIGLASAYTQ